MRVLFLDIDGVLNSKQSFIYTNREWCKKNKPFLKGDKIHKLEFCPIACSNLNYILESIPDLKIVISSGWRIGRELKHLKRILKTYGKIYYTDKVIDKTPFISSDNRGEEIAEWLKGHPEVKKFGILDDTPSNMGELLPFLFKTDFNIGLTLPMAKDIIDYFTFEY